MLIALAWLAITCLAVGLILYFLNKLIDLLPIEEPFKSAAKLLALIIGIVIIIYKAAPVVIALVAMLGGG